MPIEEEKGVSPHVKNIYNNEDVMRLGKPF